MSKATTEWLDRKFQTGKPRSCYACRCPLSRQTATVDHLIPKSRGGRDVPENFALACRPCNTKRGNEWMGRAVMDAVKGRERPKRNEAPALLAQAIRRAREAAQ